MVPVDLLVVGNVSFPVLGTVESVDLVVLLDTGGVMVGCGNGTLGPFATLATVFGMTFFVLVTEQVYRYPALSYDPPHPLEYVAVYSPGFISSI